jgi:hypothetical protein
MRRILVWVVISILQMGIFAFDWEGVWSFGGNYREGAFIEGTILDYIVLQQIDDSLFIMRTDLRVPENSFLHIGSIQETFFEINDDGQLYVLKLIEDRWGERLELDIIVGTETPSHEYFRLDQIDLDHIESIE